MTAICTILKWTINGSLIHFRLRRRTAVFEIAWSLSIIWPFNLFTWRLFQKRVVRTKLDIYVFFRTSVLILMCLFFLNYLVFLILVFSSIQFVIMCLFFDFATIPHCLATFATQNILMSYFAMIKA
jgi:hypothetical protein